MKLPVASTIIRYYVFRNPEQPMTKEYISRVNKVLDYIEKHISKNFSLEELADVAAFSKYHFHRIFYSVTGETLFQFIQRVRIERAAYQLLNNRDKTVTEVALDSGFAGSSSFAKAFKACYGVSASEWRRRGRTCCNEGLSECKPGGMYAEQSLIGPLRRDSNFGKKDSNLSNTVSNLGKASAAGFTYTSRNNINTRRTNMSVKTVENKSVEVKMFPETTVAYVRYVGPYKGDEQLFAGLYEKLVTWAGARDLLADDLVSLIVYHDNPEITDEEKLRVSVCLGVPEETEVGGEIGKMTIPGGKYVFARFEVDATQFGQAWDWVFSTWLPSSGYQPDDRPAFELYHGGKDDEAGTFDVSICVPVRPL